MDNFAYKINPNYKKDHSIANPYSCAENSRKNTQATLMFKCTINRTNGDVLSEKINFSAHGSSNSANFGPDYLDP